MKSYVCGFAFDETLGQVALIRKTRPEWQAGKLNGIGGHIEKGESSIDAMAREFEEEAGVRVAGWKPFARLSGSNGGGWEVFWFWAKADLGELRSVTDEVVGAYQVAAVRDGVLDCIPNVRWLVQMALNDARELDSCQYFELVETNRYQRTFAA